MECEVCSKGRVEKTSEKFESFTLYHCRECDLRYWWPLEEPKAEWYQNDEDYILRDSVPMAVLKPHPDSIRFLHNKAVVEIARRGGRLLDVGCGTGGFLNCARKEGFEVTGIDFDANGVRHARQVYGLSEVYVTALDDFAKQCNGRKFDAVTFFGVFEHQSKPRDFLRCVSSVLREGGIVGLTVPHYSTDTVLRWGYPPHHWLKWSRDSLTKIFEGNGFDIIVLNEYTTREVCRNVVVNWIYRNFPFLLSAKKRLVMGRPDNDRKQISKPPAGSSAGIFQFARSVWRGILLVPAGLFYLFCRLSGCRHTIFVLARKKSD
jgi:2-polyprenyl-3-methyl-5-hydroxy-6-metoxy-1,4-benzoquinol methylase